MRNSSCVLTLVAIACTFGSLIAPARSADAPPITAAVASDEELARFSLPDPTQELPLCRVKIGSKDRQLIVDTGASGMVLTSRLAQELGLVVLGGERVQTYFQAETVDSTHRPALEFAGVEFPEAEKCVLVDLDRPIQLHDREIDGILGMDVLCSFAVEVNWSQRQLRILRSPVRRSGFSVPITFDEHGLPMIKAETGGRIAYFIVDTGFRGDVSMTSELFSELVDYKLCRLLPIPSPRVDVLGKVRFHKVAELEHLSLDGNRSSHVMSESCNRNVIGNGFLARFSVTFDFPRKLAYFTKVRDTPLPQDVSGLAIERLDGEVHVIAVSDPSPAHAAGLKEGDFIVTCESKPAKTLKLADIRRRCQDPTAVLPLTVRRDGTTLEVQLDLRPEPGAKE